jgi:tetratricopeptide (TPR) repeat protein
MMNASPLSARFWIVVLTPFLLVACSSEGKLQKELAEADAQYQAGEYDRAEILYLSALRRSPDHPVALARLGIMQQEQGRIARTFPLLHRAHQLDPSNLEVRMKLAVLLVAAGDLAQAREHAEAIMEQEPTHAEVPFLLADTARTPEDVEQALERLARLPRSGSTLAAQASVLLRQGQVEQARRLAEQAQAQDPNHPVVPLILGQIAMTARDLAKAEVAFARAAELSPPRGVGRLQYARFKQQQGDTPTARKLATEMTEATPDLVPAWLIRAELAAAAKEYADAQNSIGRVLSRDPGNPQALILRARVRVAEGKAEQAVTELESMVEAYPQSHLAQMELGAAFLAANNPAGATRAFSRAAVLAPEAPEPVLSLAELNLRRGDARAAASALEPLVQKRPDLVPARVMLAQAFRATGNYDRAIALLEPLRQAAPDNPQILSLLSGIQAQRGNFDAARTGLEQVYAAQPNIVTLEQLINVDLASGNQDQATRRAQERLEQEPNSAESHILMAKVQLARRDVAAAEQSLQRAIELRPDVATSYAMLAQLYMQTGQQEQALTRLNEVLERRPQDQGALMTSAMLLEQRGDLAGAKARYERLIEVNPRSGVALNNLAYLESEQSGNFERALELAERAREIMPNDPNVADTLGWILYRRGQYPRALALLQESAQRLPDNGSVQFHIGLTRSMLGDEPGARTALTRALNTQLPDADARLARERLELLEVDALQPDPAQRARVERALAQAPQDPVALIRMSSLHRQAGQLDQAITTAEQATQATPNNISALLLLARLLEQKGETARALEIARNARRINGSDPEVAHVLGRLAFTSGDHNWAASLLQEAARRRGNDPELLFDHALAAYSVGRFDEALDAAQKARSSIGGTTRDREAERFIKLVSRAVGRDGAGDSEVAQIVQAEPNYVPALFTMATIKEEQNQAGDAVSLYERTLQLHPHLTVAQRRLAILTARQPTPSRQAMEIALRAREAFPNDAEVTKVAGIHLYRQKELNRALPLLERSSRELPNDAEVFFFLGMVQWESNQQERAKQSLEKALELKLSGDLAAQATQRLSTL